MKNGGPSLLFDVRYFERDTSRALKSSEVVAYGRRIAWYLNGEGVSLGAFHTLHVIFVSDAPDGAVEVASGTQEWWFQSVKVGVPSSGGCTEILLEAVRKGTVAVLKALAPDAAELIDDADALVFEHGPSLRILVRTKIYKAVTLDVATTIPTYVADAKLIASVRDNTSDRRVELPSLPHGIYLQAFSEATAIRLSDIDLDRAEDGALRVAWRAGSELQALALADEDETELAGPLHYSKLVRQQR